MAKFKYYFDLMSQPSRALWIAFKMGKTPFEECSVALRKREQLSEEYKKINRFQKVPCIVDGDLHLSESVAILRYLSDKGQFSETLYPKELKARAKVDEFLEWQHLSVRLGCAMYFMRLWLLPMNGLAKMPSEEQILKLQKEMENSLDIIENIWLDKSEFLTAKKLTIADIFGASEIEQTRLTKYDVSRKYPKIAEWLEKVRKESNPYYDEAHKFIYKKSA
ncbi:glutathione S-transferase theta-1 [Teleopsis dalmanni]|uniref:glutathione S-transferase theta-1 n=1 Tax=Teleopsis dalmanni TaxID=139649 RepID=UPI0018CDBB3F|nr:glutathione S-transferase theta-1 [Teleopsis dalmanni]